MLACRGIYYKEERPFVYNTIFSRFCLISVSEIFLLNISAGFGRDIAPLFNVANSQ
jgi:hypothetical protein